jgi:hypothetical protein
MSLTRIVINTPGLDATAIERVMRTPAEGARQSVRVISSFLLGLAGGARYGTVELATGSVKATATLTLTGLPTAAETFVIAGTTFTARASGATGNEFNIGADATATAAAIAAAVNASATAKVTDAVVATSALGVVTFTAKTPGAGANGLVLTESLSNATAVNFAGGSNGTLKTFDLS